eukprot:Nitzschia sp. Nitz4//scaffold48_size128905//100595//101727//NITZ4_003616-RA/size128905-augustus-gene-0.27-mRNA-1//-1//CDS//3329553030//5596//frame0
MERSLLSSSNDRKIGAAKHGRRYVRGQQEIELSSVQRYQPPSLPAPSLAVTRPTQALEPSQDRRYPVARASGAHHHKSLRQDNPAEDTTGPCPHGVCCLQWVRTQEVGIVETCGKFDEVIGPGVYCRGIWPFTVVAARLNVRVQQLDVTVGTKTIDDVFLSLTVCIQFRVIIERAYDAHYSLSSVKLQMQTYVYDIVRRTVPQMELDAVFASRREVSDQVFLHLQESIKQFGYEIVGVQVAKVSPNESVKYAMNEANAAKRMNEAIQYKAEAAKFSRIKEAEGHADTLYLHGVGIAKQREALVKGLKSALVEYKCAVETSSEAMEVLLVSQYFETLMAVGGDHLLIPTPATNILRG